MQLKNKNGKENQMKITLTFKLNDKEITLSTQEAKQLLQELKDIFEPQQLGKPEGEYPLPPEWLIYGGGPTTQPNPDMAKDVPETQPPKGYVNCDGKEIPTINFDKQ